MRTKLIIDTDPGVDDALAILAAFNSTELEIIGLTTLFGNVPVELATKNALLLRDLMAEKDARAAAIPVYQGSPATFTGVEKHRIASFVHGDDGLGNCACGSPKGTAELRMSAAEFIVEAVRAHPDQVVILALAACTNVALAVKQDPGIVDMWKECIVLGGAYRVPGNVNPAAEANFYGDPDAVDFLLSGASNVWLVGLDVTHSCKMSRAELQSGKGRFGQFIQKVSGFYLDYHKSFYNMDAAFMHDPLALLACFRKDIFTWHESPVAVATEGHLRGHAVADFAQRPWRGANVWKERPKVNIAVSVDAAKASELLVELLAHK